MDLELKYEKNDLYPRQKLSVPSTLTGMELKYLWYLPESDEVIEMSQKPQPGAEEVRHALVLGDASHSFTVSVPAQYIGEI